MQRKSADYDVFFTYVKGLFDRLDTELIRETPFQLLMAVMLSAQTTDKQVNKITQGLFVSVREPEDVVAMGIEALETSIRSVNYYRMKAKHLFATAQLLVQARQRQGSNRPLLPQTLKELMQLPGVGEKTAKVVLHILYEQPVIAVDTHVHRVVNRLGILKTKTPLQTSQKIEKTVPKHWRSHAHHAFILFGRYYCKAVKPRCSSCQLQSRCQFFSRKQKE